MWKSSPTFIVLLQLTVLGPYTLLTFLPGFGALAAYGIFRLASELAAGLGYQAPDIATPFRLPLLRGLSLPQVGAVGGLFTGSWMLGSVWGKMPLDFQPLSRLPPHRQVLGQGLLSVVCLLPCAVLVMANATQPTALQLDMSLHGPFMGFLMPGDKLVLIMFLGAFYTRYQMAQAEQATQNRLTRVKILAGK